VVIDKILTHLDKGKGDGGNKIYTMIE